MPTRGKGIPAIEGGPTPRRCLAPREQNGLKRRERCSLDPAKKIHKVEFKNVYIKKLRDRYGTDDFDERRSALARRQNDGRDVLVKKN